MVFVLGGGDVGALVPRLGDVAGVALDVRFANNGGLAEDEYGGRHVLSGLRFEETG